ncbi:MAG: hypothetical protein HND51_12785 [Chloroflexi bacterium]|nr:hypothetical protein [Chloroflexota bacterium]
MMNFPSSTLLLIGAMASFGVTLLHILLVFRPQLYRYFGADELADMVEDGSSFTVLVTLGLVVMFAVWGIYGLSGAGVLDPLPLLDTVLIIIGGIYILRGVMLLNDMVKLAQGTRPIRFALLSIGALSAGLLHLFGTLA